MKFSSSLLPSLEGTLRQDHVVWNEAKSSGINQAGLLLNFRALKADEDHFAGKDYWQALLKELYELICTDSEKYLAVRQRLKKVENATSDVIVPTIAVAITDTLGLPEGILVPFVALSLFAIMKLGVNSWCAVNKNDIESLFGKIEISDDKKTPKN